MSRPVTVLPVPAMGTEDVVVADNGLVYTGTEDGSVFSVRPDGGRVERVGHTGGRPLGLELLPDGRLLVADAREGLLVMELGTGRIERLVDSVDGRRMLFCNNAAVASNGDIWFSDTSTRYGIERWKNEIVENVPTGRLLCRRADGGVVETHLDNLAFANGVALAADESYVVVAETGARRIVRLWLTGDRAGQRELFCDDMSGYPDNVALGSDGLIWVSIGSPKNLVIEALQHGPMALRKSATRLPEAIQPKPARTVRAMAFDDTGTCVHDVNGDARGFHMVTGAREHDGMLWLGSLHEPAVAVVQVPPL